MPEPSTFGTASSVNVTVSGGSGTPTGSVTVKEGATTLGTGTLTDRQGVGRAASDAAGRERTRLTVHYAGDATYGLANGQRDGDRQGQAAATTTTTARPPEEGQAQASPSRSVTVTSAGGTPTGTVEIYDGSKLLGTGTLADGTVTIHIAKKRPRSSRRASTP